MIQSIEDRVGQMIMAGFDGLTAPEYFLDWLREGTHWGCDFICAECGIT
jgi:hypothetical protein